MMAAEVMLRPVTKGQQTCDKNAAYTGYHCIPHCRESNPILPPSITHEERYRGHEDDQRRTQRTNSDHRRMTKT